MQDCIAKAKYDISEKIKDGKDLTPDELKILKLSLFIQSETYYEVDFSSTDRKKDIMVS
jgi:hypothetical protein